VIEKKKKKVKLQQHQMLKKQIYLLDEIEQQLINEDEDEMFQ
jgi:hypothetical protein